MKTSYFRAYNGPGAVSIARFAPNWYRTGYGTYRVLAPEDSILRLPYKEFYSRYKEKLYKLDPQQVWSELHTIHKDHEPILLCWENLNIRGQWCHRTMVAEWFNKTLGEIIHEIR